jgi:hypothetical protein
VIEILLTIQKEYFNSIVTDASDGTFSFTKAV